MTGAEVDYNGSPAGYTADPQEIILYVDAHDNETLFDALAYKLPQGTSMADRARMQQLSLSTVALGQGVRSSTPAPTCCARSRWTATPTTPATGSTSSTAPTQTNGFGVGLPPAPDNESKWPFMRPLLADPALKPAKADIVASVERFRDLLAVADSSPLFCLTTAEQVQTKLQHLNTGKDQVPGLLVMHLDDTVGGDVDPARERVVVLVNATDAPQSYTVAQLAQKGLTLSRGPGGRGRPGRQGRDLRQRHLHRAGAHDGGLRGALDAAGRGARAAR